MDIFGKKRIAQLEESLETQKRLFDIQQAGWREMEQRYRQLNTQFKVLLRALGKTISRVDPLYGVDEADPARKAASDALGDQVIAKLIGEHKASNSFGDH